MVVPSIEFSLIYLQKWGGLNFLRFVSLAEMKVGAAVINWNGNILLLRQMAERLSYSIHIGHFHFYNNVIVKGNTKISLRNKSNVLL